MNVRMQAAPNRTARSAAVRDMVVLALFTAIVLLMAATPIGLIDLPLIKATILHVPVIIGAIVKHIEVIPDKFIPLILLVFGIGGALAIMGPTVDAVIQGVLVTGAAVYGNQLVKQMGKSE